MRREHNSGSASPTPPSPSGIPFEENLIFYAPLTQGDLTDHISGVTGTASTGTTITWDSTKGMYLIDTDANNGANQFEGFCFNVNGTINLHNTDAFTLYAHVEQTYGLGNNWDLIAYLISSNKGSYIYCTAARMGFPNGGGYNTNHGTRVIGEIALTWNPGDTYPLKTYYNGTLTSQDTSGFSSQSNILTSLRLVGIGINQTRYTYYIKDVRVYNRALSASEIQYIIDNPYEPTPSQNPPSAPTGVSASMQSGGVLVSWNVVYNATSYKVYRSNSSSGTYTLLSTQNSVNYMDQSPLSGYNYYKIIASNEHGDSDYSSAASVNFVAPSTPTGLNGIKNGNSIILSWSAVSNAVSYKIYRCATAGGTYMHYDNTSLTNYTDTSPLTGDNYYKVSAYNAAGESDLSSYVYIDNSTPSSYTELNYLESTGNPSTGVGQVIDTGLKPRYLKTEIKFKEAHYCQATGNLQLACGCWNPNNNRYYPVEHGDSRYSNNGYISSATKTNSIYKLAATNINLDHIVIYNEFSTNAVSIDGVQKFIASDITVSDSSLTYNVYLFGAGTATFSTGYIADAWRIYYAKFWDKQTRQLVRHFIPVLDSNNVPCMYDKVTEQFFYNVGTGTFLYG